jgi:hypothetical protein
MNENDIVRTVTVKYQSIGADQVKTDATEIAKAQDQLAASSNNLATVTETSAKRQTSQLSTFERMEAASQKQIKALNDLARAQTVANNVLNNPAVDDQRIINFLQTYVDRADAATAAAERLAQVKIPTSAFNIDQRMGIGAAVPSAQQSADAFLAQFGGLDGIAQARAAEIGKAFSTSLDESLIAGVGKSAKDSAAVFQEQFDKLDAIASQQAKQIGQNFQTSLNESFGIGAGPSKSAAGSAAVFNEAADAQDKMSASAARLRAAINPLEAEQGRLAAQVLEWKKALDSGAISQDQFAAGQAIAGKRLGDFAQSLKVAGGAGRVMSGELVNLSYQLNDVATGIALGQSPFMIMAQQGGQVFQIFQTSKASIGELATTAVSSFGSIFTAGRVAFGGIAAAIGAAIYSNASYISSQREVEKALIGIAGKTQTTAAQINSFAQQNATATGLSVDQARNVAVEFTKTGNIAVAGLKGVGDAVHGFATLTGESVGDASKAFAKAFSGDIVSGAEELNKTYGFLDASTRDYIRTLELQGDRSAAIQVVLDAMAKDNQRAADSVGFLTKAYNALTNAASAAKNAIGLSTAPQAPEDQLAGLEKQKASLQNPAPRRATDPLAALADIVPPSLGAVNSSIEALQKKIDSIKSDNVVKQLKAMSLAGDDVVRATIPQIAQIEHLEAALEKLHAAQMTPGVRPGALAGQDDTATTAIQNQVTALKNAEAEAARYNQAVKVISASWGNVSQATALSLQASHNQLSVLEAVGGAAKMAAQHTADYRNYMIQGKAATDAAAMAASNLAAAHAQVNAAAKETLFTLQNQAAAAGAVTGAEQMAAQAQATYVSLVREGVSSLTAEAVAAQQLANAQDAATAAVTKQVEALKDQNAMLIAQAKGLEKSTAAAIAYKNAIESGASEESAMALKTETARGYTIRATDAALQWQQNLLGVASAAQQVEDSIARADLASKDAAEAARQAALQGTFNPDPTLTHHEGNTVETIPYWQKQSILNGPMGQAPPNLQTITDNAIGTGGLDAAIAAVEGTKPGTTTNSAPAFLQKAYGFVPDGVSQSTTISQSDIVSMIGQLYQTKNAQTSDKSQQLANDRNELAFLQSQPQTLDTINAINSLKSSMDSLSKSTDTLNSTNQEALSPYYTQDPRTSHIGFRSQGMATGGYVDVPGSPSANDNMMAMIPVASGERISVDPMSAKRGVADSSTTVNNNITINVPVTIVGAAAKDQNEIGRTVYQAAQNAARQLQRAAQ